MILQHCHGAIGAKQQSVCSGQQNKNSVLSPTTDDVVASPARREKQDIDAFGYIYLTQIPAPVGTYRRNPIKFLVLRLYLLSKGIIWSLGSCPKHTHITRGNEPMDFLNPLLLTIFLTLR